MYCAWSGKAVEASPETCKKSNSTGFSKIWRFRELANRSNSDGRDAFVFLNNNNESKTTSPSKTEEKREGEVKPASVSSNNNESRTTTCSKREELQNSDGGKGKVKSNGKKKTPPLSAHELHYVRNRALREGDRRRSYLPYKPELVGFFTNVNGGLSRNVHPF